MNKKDKDKLTPEERFCLDGWLRNHNADLAYKLSRPKPINCTDENLHRLALRWLRKPHIREYLEQQGAVITAEVGADNTANRDRDAIIKELNVLANQTSDNKQRADLLMKIADLERMKDTPKEDVQDNTIHYYLPLSCHDCSLYLANREKLGNPTTFRNNDMRFANRKKKSGG